MTEMLVIADGHEILGKAMPVSGSPDEEGFWKIFAMASRNMYFMGEAKAIKFAMYVKLSEA